VPETRTIFRPLTIDDQVKAEIAELRQRAEANPIPVETMRERAAAFHRGAYIPSINLDMTIKVPEGYMVTFETEDHDAGRMRHLAVSLDAPDKAPVPEAVVSIMREFGFVNVLQDCVVFPQPCEDGVIAMHVVEPIDGNMQRLHASAQPSPANNG
jgi:hypothetical protein